MKVFISYGKEDQAIALKIYHDLKKSGASPWIDSEDILPGQNWKREKQNLHIGKKSGTHPPPLEKDRRTLKDAP